MKWTERPRDIAKRLRNFTSLALGIAFLLFARGFFGQFHPNVRGKWNPLAAELTAWDAMIQGVTVAAPMLIIALLSYFASKHFHFLADKELMAKQEAEAAARLTKELNSRIALPTAVQAPAAPVHDLAPPVVAAPAVVAPEPVAPVAPAAPAAARFDAPRPGQVPAPRYEPPRRDSAPRPVAPAASADTRGPNGNRPDRDRGPDPRTPRERRPLQQRPDPRLDKGAVAGSPRKREPMLRPATEPRIPSQAPGRQPAPETRPRPAVAKAGQDPLRDARSADRPATTGPRPQIQGARPGTRPPGRPEVRPGPNRPLDKPRPRVELRSDDGKAAAEKAIATAKKLLNESKNK